MEKQFSKGLFLLTTYTFSKSITDANSSLGGFFSRGARDLIQSLSRKGTGRLQLAAPVCNGVQLRIAHRPGEGAAQREGTSWQGPSGWQVNGILTYNSGTPIQIGVSNTRRCSTGVTLPIPSPGRIPAPSVSVGSFDPNRDKYLNINAFGVPANGKIGTSGQVLPNVRTFFNMNEDFGILKRSYITETMNVELRFELFNAFNRVIFGGPDSNISSPNFGTVSGQANGPRKRSSRLEV